MRRTCNVAAIVIVGLLVVSSFFHFSYSVRRRFVMSFALSSGSFRITQYYGLTADQVEPGFKAIQWISFPRIVPSRTTNQHYSLFEFPLLWIALPVSAASSWMWIRARRFKGSDRCNKCGYTLVNSGRCPECGTETDRSGKGIKVD